MRLTKLVLTHQLKLIEECCSSMVEITTSGLLEETNGLRDLLGSSSLEEEKVSSLINSSDDLQTILTVYDRLEELVDDKAKFRDCINFLDNIERIYKSQKFELPIIENIHKRSKLGRERLIINLCCRLSNLYDLEEDDLLEIIHTLAECGTFSERDLRLKYLQARDKWFNDTCEAKSSSFDDVIVVFERDLPLIHREYTSIFCQSSRDSSNGPDSVDLISEKDDVIIDSWLLLKATTFISSLDSYLSSIRQSTLMTPTLISDTMSKCFKLASSLSSIGLDFSSRLKPLFSDALMSEIRLSIDRATTKFETQFTLAISKSIETLLLPVDDEILRVSNMKSEEKIPRSIDHYPVFRIYCLHLIDSLRWIRTTRTILSPISLCQDTYAALNNSLTRVMKALAVILNTDNNSNHPILSKIAISFLTDILPYFSHYCGLIFPERPLLMAMGLSKAEFNFICNNEPEKLSNFRLDLKKIADPIRNTMPALLQVIEK